MTRVATLTVLDVLEGARGLVARPDGWCRRWTRLRNYGLPQVCALSAIAVAAGDGTLLDDSAVLDLLPLMNPESVACKAMLAIADQLPPFHDGVFYGKPWLVAWKTVVHFNDTADQVGVVAAFDRAIQAERSAL